MNYESKLLETLIETPKSKKIKHLIKLSENESFVDITHQSAQLSGVWELRWSSSKSPLLNYSPILDNLQILDPERRRGLNFLRLRGDIGNLFATAILAELDIIDRKRTNITFKKAGILGPQFFGKNIRFLSELKRTQKGWLDTSILTNKLRVCRGYKGTTFALVKRDDLSISTFFNSITN
tara:strand:- start:72 stop:611 length:540 start_codon:yes stop_codon:yes gene_type:complete